DGDDNPATLSNELSASVEYAVFDAHPFIYAKPYADVYIHALAHPLVDTFAHALVNSFAHALAHALADAGCHINTFDYAV
ncbi:MAG: hypothetical protein KJZ52_11705, partial [Anaerolineales bacterium]|nr:hypothetical protein [Anaerolineales bacterium]